MDDIIDPEKALERIDAQMARANPAAAAKKRLPPTETFELDCLGTNGTRYQGVFFYQVPRIGDQFKITTLKASFLPLGSVGDAQGAQLADMIAYLTVCIRFSEHYPKPSWWAPAEAYDPTPYQDLFGRCLEYEDRFHGRHADDRGDGDGSQTIGQPARGGADDLGGEVPPAAERRETLAGDGA